MTTPTRTRYVGYRFPAEIISHAVWLYFLFPLSLRIGGWRKCLNSQGWNRHDQANIEFAGFVRAASRVMP
jgi:transposase-like protein